MYYSFTKCARPPFVGASWPTINMFLLENTVLARYSFIKIIYAGIKSLDFGYTFTAAQHSMPPIL